MTTYLSSIWDLDTQLGLSAGCRVLYARAMCSVPGPLPCWEEKLGNSQLSSFNAHSHGVSFSEPGITERRTIKPCTAAAWWKCSILRQVSPLMCCSSNKSTGKQSIAAFSLVLPLPIFSCIFSLRELMKGHTRMSNEVLTNESFWCFSRSWIKNTNQRSHFFTSHRVQQGVLG